jgi:hypothetical protein
MSAVTGILACLAAITPVPVRQGQTTITRRTNPMAFTSRWLSRVIIGGLGMLAVIASATPSLAASPGISFTGSGSDHGSCASRPDPRTASMTTRDRVELVNHTASRAAIEVNGQPTPFTVEPGESQSLALAVGVWKISLRPRCRSGRAVAIPLTIRVLAARSAPRSPRSPAVAPARSLAPSPGGAAGASQSTSDPAGVRIGPAYAVGQASSTPAPGYLLTLVALFGVIGVGTINIKVLLLRRRRRSGVMYQ